MKKYKPLLLAKARDWNDIEIHYSRIESEECKNLSELVKHIRNSGLDKRIFAFNSFNKLVVSIYNPIDAFKEALHITFDNINKTWNFEYHAIPFQDPEFCSLYDSESGIEKFDDFIKKIRW